MKKSVEIILNFLTKRIIAKYGPEIVGVTGSVGKTSAREAIYTLLRAKFKTQIARSLKNYNNEIGLPLAILQQESGSRSLSKWLAILSRAVSLWLRKDPAFPQAFVLEMGADHVGDISKLVRNAPPRVGVITAIGPSHLEFFETIENIIEEKSKIISVLPADGLAVLNRDDARVFNLKNRTRARVISYGFHPEADVRASDLRINEINAPNLERVERLKGISFKLHYKGSVVPFFIDGILGVQHVYAVLAAVAVGDYYDLNLIEMANGIKEYRPQPGRMNLIKGIKHSLIIDDTYNAAPASCLAALNVFERIDLEKPSEKWAILGDMLELGSASESGHREVGVQTHQSGATYLVTVGERARDIARGAREAGMSEANVYSFDNTQEAGKFIEDRMEKGDLVLVKGSQGARMERIVKELMADPLSAPSLLVRQGDEWTTK